MATKPAAKAKTSSLPNVPIPAGHEARGNLPAWEITSLDQLYSAGLLSGVTPDILAAIDLAESSGQGGSINSAGYGGWFGLGANSNYGPGWQDTPALLHGTNQTAFDVQAETAAHEFAKMLAAKGSGILQAESAYQTGPNAPYDPFGEGVRVFQGLGIGGTATGYNPNVVGPEPVNLAGPPPAGGGQVNIQPGQGNAAAGEVAGALGTQITPQTINQIIQDALLQQQVPLNQAAFQDQLRFLAQNYGYTQQEFGLQQAQLGLQRQSLYDQTAHLQAGYGFQQQQDVLTGKSIQAAIGEIKKQFGISMGELGLQQTQARQGLAASGVYNTGARTQEEQSFGFQRAAATASEQYQLFQESQAQAGLKLTEAEQKEQFGYSFKQLLNGQHQLDIQYQQLGISKAQAATQYQNAVQQLGLGNLMNGIQLEQQMAVLAGGGYSPIGQFMQQLTTLLPFTAGAFTNPGVE